MKHKFLSNGLTLPELLVASVIGMIMIAIGLTVSQNALQTNYKLLTSQRLRDNWNKITLLLNADIAESCSATGSGSTLTLRVLPSPETSSNQCALSTSSAGEIIYSLSGTTLSRNGPRVRSDGSLSSGGLFLNSATQTISTNVSLFEIYSDGSADKYLPSYRLTLSQNGVSYTGNNTNYQVSRPRVRSFD